MNFVDYILRVTKESESPRRYYYWAALMAIAAVMKNEVYLDKFYYKLYPNIYCLLVGKSGLRKGPPINLTKRLVEIVDNTRVIDGRVTIQQVIETLSKAVTKERGGPPLTTSSGLLISSEFAAFIVEDPSALTILTDLYDAGYHPSWTYRTISRGDIRLKFPTISFFGASNDVHLKTALPPNAIGGGFVARTFIIYSDKKARVNSLTDEPEFMVPTEDLAKHLSEIAKARGKFRYADAAKGLYNEWYNAFSRNDTDDGTGTLERIHDHILKTAMLLSLARGPSLVLELSDMEEAIKACQDFVPGSKRVEIGQGGASVSAAGTAVLLKELITNDQHEICRSKALQKHWAHFDSFELDRIAESLQVQGAIKIQPRREEGAIEVYYILNQKVLERYLERERKKGDRDA